MSARSQEDVDRALAAFDAWPMLYHTFRNGPAHAAAAPEPQPEPVAPIIEPLREAEPEPVAAAIAEPPVFVAEPEPPAPPAVEPGMFRRLSAGSEQPGALTAEPAPDIVRRLRPAAMPPTPPPASSLPGLRDLFRRP